MGDTRSGMIEVAATMLRRAGYRAMTLVDVVDAGGLPRGSIYHHFPGGKPELAIEALRYINDGVSADIGAALRRATTPAEVVAEVFIFQARELEASGFRDGCWFATTALELGPDDDDLAGVLDERFHQWEAALAATFERTGLGPDDDVGPMSAARLLIATLEGGLIRARVARDVRLLTDLIPVVCRALPDVTD
ncbi:MAG: TetR/AcrR family transcriptional regulator [Actinomycetota bacterium]